MSEIVTEIQVDGCPEAAEEFRALLGEKLSDPAQTAALFILSLDTFLSQPQRGLEMIALLRGQTELDETERKYQLTPLAEQAYLPRAYYKGALAENGYTPALPRTVVIKYDEQRGKDKNKKTVYIGCGGTGTYRPITLKRLKKRAARKFLQTRRVQEEAWFVTEYPSILLPVKKPENS